MIHKLLKGLKVRGSGSGFVSYYGDLLDGSDTAAPTVDEARKDYRAMIHAQSGFLTH